MAKKLFIGAFVLLVGGFSALNGFRAWVQSRLDD